MQSPDGVKAIAAVGVRAGYPGGWRKPRVEALRGVDLHVGTGEIMGLLGPNGSGKSTLMRILAGLADVDNGTVSVLGGDPDDRAITRRVGYLPEGKPAFHWLSGRRMLCTMGQLQGMAPMNARDRADHWLERLDLMAAAKRRVATYSTGMAQRIGLAAALMPEPDLLLLDEPTSGLDPLGSERVMEILSEHRNAGRSVLLASHHMAEVETLCDRVAILVAGRIQAAGPLDELLGTGAEALVVRGLDAAGWQRVTQAVTDAGGNVTGRRTERRHLFEVFRESVRNAGGDRRG